MSGDLVKLTVYLTPEAHAALEEAAQETRDTKTDTINRALRIYNQVLWAARQDSSFTFQLNNQGDKVRVRPTIEIAPRT